MTRADAKLAGEEIAWPFAPTHLRERCLHHSLPVTHEVNSELDDAARILEEILLEGDRPARVLAICLLESMGEMHPLEGAKNATACMLAKTIAEADLSLADMSLIARLRAFRKRGDA